MAGERYISEQRGSRLSRILRPLGRAVVPFDREAVAAQNARTESLLKEVTESAAKATAAAEELNQTIEENNRFWRTGVPDPEVQPTLFEE